MADEGHELTRGCAGDRVLRLLWGDWTTHILWSLGHNGPTRFRALQRRIEGISGKVLTERLRRLESEGLVFRDYEPTIPPKVTYGLTERGQELDAALRALEVLADRWEAAGGFGAPAASR